MQSYMKVAAAVPSYPANAPASLSNLTATASSSPTSHAATRNSSALASALTTCRTHPARASQRGREPLEQQLDIALGEGLHAEARAAGTRAAFLYDHVLRQVDGCPQTYNVMAHRFERHANLASPDSAAIRA